MNDPSEGASARTRGRAAGSELANSEREEMSREKKKRAAAEAALDFVEWGTVVGVGTGSTAERFIDALARVKGRIEAAVASSEATAARLAALRIPLIELNDADELPVYVDGADEVNGARELIKGGGGALTREKILAAACRRFVCIVDDSKVVARLGRFPLPIEVVPMARQVVARDLARRGGEPRRREGFVTDNGNVILDVAALDLGEPAKIESELNQIAGVVTNGLFALRPADVVLIGADAGVERIG